MQTLTFRTLHVLFFIAHGRREVVHANVTASPTAAWAWPQVLEATPWGCLPRFLVRDRDRASGADFVRRAAALGIQVLLTPIRAPRANAVAERMVRTFRSECCDHLVVPNERHFRALLAEFVRYYTRDRPHRTLGLEPPRPAPRRATGPIRAAPVLGGPHHAYERAA